MLEEQSTKVKNTWCNKRWQKNIKILGREKKDYSANQLFSVTHSRPNLQVNERWTEKHIIKVYVTQ